MTTLVLQPGASALVYHLFADTQMVLTDRLQDYSESGAVQTLTDQARPDHIAIQIAFGASEFSSPAIASKEVVEKLEALVSSAPLHLPPAIRLVRLCATLLPHVPIVLVFDTAFFATLPDREANYGIDLGIAKRIEARRHGYHGIYHAAAVAEGAERLARMGKANDSARLLSVCLDPQPEVVGALGGQPLTVTGGTTPLEGLPGERSCGEIDPSIVLELAVKEGWGPEQIDYTLTHESGLQAIAGRDLTVGEALSAEGRQMEPAGRHLRYKILLAAGAAVAALDGLDGIVFSGRYRTAGEYLGPWLARRLHFQSGECADRPRWFYLDKDLPRLILDAALVAAGVAFP